eukprot:7237941-Pyramimonas_sp.AAC.1
MWPPGGHIREASGCEIALAGSGGKTRSPQGCPPRPPRPRPFPLPFAAPLGPHSTSLVLARKVPSKSSLAARRLE